MFPRFLAEEQRRNPIRSRLPCATCGSDRRTRRDACRSSRGSAPHVGSCARIGSRRRASPDRVFTCRPGFPFIATLRCGRVTVGLDAPALVREIGSLVGTCPGCRPDPASVAGGMASRASDHELDRRFVPGAGRAPCCAWRKHSTQHKPVASPLSGTFPGGRLLRRCEPWIRSTAGICNGCAPRRTRSNNRAGQSGRSSFCANAAMSSRPDSALGQAQTWPAAGR